MSLTQISWLTRTDGYRLPALLLGLLAVTIWGLSLLPQTADSRLLVDGRTFYCGGHILNAGGNPYDESALRRCGHDNGTTIAPLLHAPPSLPLFQLLALLPLPLAMAVLTLLQITALIYLLREVWRLALPHGPAVMAVLLPLLLVADATADNLVVGQVNLIAFALAWWSVQAFRTGRPAASGAALMIAVLLKPYLGLLFLPLLQPRTLLAGLGIALLAGTLAWVQDGLTLWQQFAETTHTLWLPGRDGLASMDWVAQGNLGLSGLLQQTGLPPAAVSSVHLVGAAGFLLTVSMLTLRRRPTDRLPLVHLTLPLCVLLPGMSWPTYLLWALPTALAQPRSRIWLFVPLLLPYGRLVPLAGPVILLPATLCLLLLWLLALSDAAARTAVR